MFAKKENSAATTLHRIIKIHFLRQEEINSLNSHTIPITKTFYIHNLTIHITSLYRADIKHVGECIKCVFFFVCSKNTTTNRPK